MTESTEGRLALDEKYIGGFVEGRLERIGKVDPEEGRLFWYFWEDETQREVVKGKPKGRL